MAVGDDEDAWLTELEAATSETELAGEPIAEEDLSWLAADEVSDSERGSVTASRRRGYGLAFRS